jgi:hypothetical protein
MMKKVGKQALLMVVGAFILTCGMFIGNKVGNAQSIALNAGTVSDERILKTKSDIIDKVVKVDDSVSNKFIASRKASELSNLDIEKLEELSKKGITVIVVANSDVYEKIDKTRAEENKVKNEVTDAVYIPSQQSIVISATAPTGVLTKQVASIVQ